MKTTLINMIASIVRHLVGSDLWSLIVISVINVEKTGQSGSEKREAVITGLRAMTSTVATWLVNLAIEAAVAKLKVTK
jgi:hypothetical protein